MHQDKTSTKTEHKKQVTLSPASEEIEIRNIVSDIHRTILPVGTRIGRYRIIEEIDRGGMSVVYKACQTDLDRIVALKVLPANITLHQKFVERFIAEAHSIAKLNHSNIVSIYEVSVENNVYFLAMDYIQGKNLYHYLIQNKPKVVTVLEIIRQLTDALQYAHDQQILHRDLKLNNIIMRDNKIPVLIDFGIAKIMNSKEEMNLTKTGEIIGSPAYMAPERIMGSGSDKRSDICSLGIMLYEMLTFKNPYLDLRSMVQTTKNVIEANPVSPRKLVSWLDPQIESITLKAMHPIPEKRYQTMSEFGNDIARYQRGESVLASPPTIGSKLKKLLKEYWVHLTIASLIYLIFCIGFGVWYYVTKSMESKWQLVYRNEFEKKPSLVQWSVENTAKRSAKNVNSGAWTVADSALHPGELLHSYLRFERSFTSDIRVEFDIFTKNGILADAGFFLYGNSPENAFIFWINRDGRGLNGISYPGSDFLFYDYAVQDFVPQDRYHVIIEKHNQALSFFLNKTLIAVVYDCFPLLGRDYQKIGFIGSIPATGFDNLKVYRKGQPLLIHPTMIADRFWEQGDFESAYSEYSEILTDVSNKDLGKKIHLKMVDCLVRMDEIQNAESLLKDEEAGKDLPTDFLTKVVLYHGLANWKKGYSLQKNFSYRFLAEQYPQSIENTFIGAQAVKLLHNFSVAQETDSLLMQMDLFIKRYPDHIQCFEQVIADYLNKVSLSGNIRMVDSLVSFTMNHFENRIDAQVTGKIYLARNNLARQDKQKAIDLLNQIIGSTQQVWMRWDAWLLLAEIYRCDRDYHNSTLIYKSIMEKCPQNNAAYWSAVLNLYEITKIVSIRQNEISDTLLDMVTVKNHAFVKYFLIARFYKGTINEARFRKEWQAFYPDSKEFLYYVAKNDLIAKKPAEAAEAFKLLLKAYHPNTWEYLRTLEELNAIR